MTEDASNDFESGSEEYRTCPECGADCVPEPFLTDQVIHLGFTCPVHGVHTVIDPLDSSR